MKKEKFEIVLARFWRECDGLANVSKGYSCPAFKSPPYQYIAYLNAGHENSALLAFAQHSRAKGGHKRFNKSLKYGRLPGW
jgi:hypothetical protein